jgi:hypothetical protein
MDPVLEAFMSRVEEIRIQYIEHVSSGSLADYASYQKACGTIEGLSLAVRELKDILSGISSDPDGFDIE